MDELKSRLKTRFASRIILGRKETFDELVDHCYTLDSDLGMYEEKKTSVSSKDPRNLPDFPPYERDVEGDKFLQPSDFFMSLYSLAVTGTARDMITGQVGEMMTNGETGDAMKLLKTMDSIFRNRNADRTASNLLHACRQFRDGSLSSFLPRFQTLLARSPMSNIEDRSRVQERNSRVRELATGFYSLESNLIEKEMNGKPFIIDAFINNTFSVSTLIDNGCECLAAISDSLVRKKNLPRIQITSLILTKATNDKRDSNEIITEVTHMELDIDGYSKTLYACVISGLPHPLIQGKPCMEREDVTYFAKKKGYKRNNAKSEHSSMNIASSSAGVFLSTIRRANKTLGINKTHIFSVTLADIQKALAPDKDVVTSLDKLPKKYKKFSNLFQKEITDKLTPHRPGCDHEIKLQDGKDAPWGPLYGMSRDGLLFLRKTLTDLLDKSYIRASSSPSGAPVLFVRIPGGGLCFCEDYRAFNAISQVVRYPLPLIKETLSKLSNAKWFTKLDV
ncbi:hypothetical protein EPUL_003669 [Erysiphe pulchra]|uniref:Uncharacterized protein n=1 Tax=Erysiphe pulchra TaxID=225359 RepID=A0A2S4PQI6_9PEZI|nr:hypothetical protein EPUL_003669 [Erysiphe pulchra]